MKTSLTSVFSFALLFTLISCFKGEEVFPTEADDDPHRPHSASVSHAIVIDPINGEVPVGKSLLIRKENGIAMFLKTSGLFPKHTFTCWWVIWNNPENCIIPGACSDLDFASEGVNVDVLFASGDVSNYHGALRCKAYLKEGDTSGSINELLGLEPIGLVDSKKAEVHLVVRSHGPIIPGQLQDQIGSFGGGCTIFIDPFIEVPDEEGECADIQFAIHSPPM